MIDLADALVTVGIAVVVPLGAWLSLVVRRDGTRDGLQEVAGFFVAISALGALLTVTQPRGSSLAIGSAGVSLLASALLAIAAVRRVAARGLVPLDELAIDTGSLLLPVGSAFWLASRAQTTLGGFGEPIVTYTAAHFHFAGCAAPIIVGAIGRLGFARGAVTSRAYRVAAIAVMLGVPLTGLGIAGGRVLERGAAIVLACGMLIAATVGVRVAIGLTGRALIWRALLVVSFVGLVVPMALAVAFTLTGSAGIGRELSSLLPLATMLRWHGTVNALVFAVPALIACVALRALPRHPPFGFPMSRLRGTFRIGADFFARHGALGGARAPTGIVDRLADYASPDFDPSRVDDEIRHFYEHTGAYAMTITPTWFAPFITAGRIWRRVARAIGQTELPTDAPHGEDVESRIVDLRDEVDGRASARGWVRTYVADGRALYVAAYAATPSFDRTLMNIAFPLPFGALVSVLRFAKLGVAGGLRVTTEDRPGEGPGDEGIYFETRWLRIRLPMREWIDVIPSSTPGEATARHEIVLFGRRFLRLDYHLQRRR